MTAQTARSSFARRSTLVVLVSLALLLGPAAAFGEALTLPALSGASATVVVTARPDVPDVLTYSYRVTHGGSSMVINEVRLEIATGAGDARLTTDGLRNTATGLRPSSGMYLEELGPERIVPVGFVSAPEGWSAGISGDGDARWGSQSEAADIGPGQTSAPFVIDAHGLPGLRTLHVAPDQWENLPTVEEVAEAGLSLDDLDAAESAAAVKITTIGPVAPPAVMDPQAFCGRVESALASAVELGWVRAPGVAKSLAKKLANMKAAVERGQPETARNIGQALLNEIDGAACTEPGCPGNKPITPEGHALLHRNVAYLLDHL